jgi:prepilin-type processing-associated H-X9-DG protein
MVPPSTTDPSDAAPLERFQFRIRDLLLVMLLVALGAGSIVQWSPPLFLLFLAVGGYCAYMWRALWKPISLVQLLVVISLIGIHVALFLPAIQTSHSRRRPPCTNNLMQIVLALHNYHETYGSLPPAYVADKNGRPQHSWRVLLLPFLERQDLYDRYHFDEPWDGPNNRKLANEIVRLYSCPTDHPRPSTETSYVAVVGPHTPWPGGTTLTFDDFQDGSHNVLLVVEIHDSGIHWMEPRDLHVSQMSPTISAPHGQGISSDHPHGANAAFADGATRYLYDSIPADVLRSWINLDDGTLPEPPQP